MKALFRNDWYIYRNRIIAIASVVWVVIALFYVQIVLSYYHMSVSRGISFESYISFSYLSFSGYITLWTIMKLPLSVIVACMSGAALSRGNKSGWIRFTVSMPYTKRQIIAEKLLFGLLIMTAHNSCVILSQSVFLMIGNVFTMELFLRMCSILWTTQLIIAAFVTPMTVYISLGSAAIITFMFGSIVYELIVSVIEFLREKHQSYEFRMMIVSFFEFLFTPVGCLTAIAFAAALYALSCLLTIRLFERKKL